jgi:hypothetical protein
MPPMQTDAGQHKNFGQPVVRDPAGAVPEDAKTLLTPAQAAARFQIPEYRLRKACSEGALEHVRVVNTLWLKPAAVALFVSDWQAHRGPKPPSQA